MLPGLTKIHWPEYQLGGILAIFVDDRSGRQVLDCASPLALLIGWREEVLLSARENGSAGRADEKRQRAAALKNGAAPAHWFLNSNARQASRLHAPAGRLLYLTGGTPVLPCAPRRTSFRLCACIRTMNPPLTPTRRGTDSTPPTCLLSSWERSGVGRVMDRAHQCLDRIIRNVAEPENHALTHPL